MALAPGRTEAQLVAACELLPTRRGRSPLIKQSSIPSAALIAVIPSEPSAELSRLPPIARAPSTSSAPRGTPEDHAGAIPPS